MKKLIILMIFALSVVCFADNDYRTALRSYEANSVYAEYFELETEWSGNDATITSDTTNVRFYETDANSTKMTSDGSDTDCYMQKTPGGIDLSGCDMYYSFYVNDADVTSVQLWFFNGGSLSKVTIHHASAAKNEVDGWVFGKLNPSASDRNNNGDAVLQNVTAIRIYATASSATSIEVTADALIFVPEQPEPLWSMCFDDGPEEDYEMAKYLHSEGVRATFFILPSTVDSPANLTSDEVEQMRDWGHCIANHSDSGDQLVADSQTPAVAANSINTASKWLYDNGCYRGANIWAVPGGSDQLYGWSGHPSTLRNCYDAVRTTGSGAYYPEILCMYEHPLYGKVIPTTRSATGGWTGDPNTLTYLDDQYVDNNSLIVSYWHNANDNTISDGDITDEFKDFISQLKASEYKIVTLDELVYTKYWSDYTPGRLERFGLDKGKKQQ
jgi:peptidoglycan/xylan/chitin deacetylase (PgdA/CDA1 family)